MKIIKQTPGPAALTETSDFVSISGQIRDFDGILDCDIDFKETLATPDAELPAARGGVEGPPRRVRRTPNQRKGRSSRQ